VGAGMGAAAVGRGHASVTCTRLAQAEGPESHRACMVGGSTGSSTMKTYWPDHSM